jgi:hypothetical protein
MSVSTRPAAEPVVLVDQNGEIPPLESGDRLTRAEFLRRYDAMPDLKFVLKEGRFETLPASADGLLRSTIFPGLWLDPAALVRRDSATILAAIQQGVNSPEHAEFAASLKASASPR